MEARLSAISIQRLNEPILLVHFDEFFSQIYRLIALVANCTEHN